MTNLDTLIIGSGPAGLTAAIYAQRAAIKSAVLEKDYLATGQIANSDRVDNYPGLYGLSGYELGEKFREQAVALGAEFITGEAKKITRAGDSWQVDYTDEYGKEQSICTKTIIYAAGAAHRRLDVPGETLMGVSYCATCDGFFYRDKDIAVVGGGDTALSDALLLAKTSAKVYLIHRRDTFRGAQSLVKKIKETENIELILGSTVDSINGEKRVESITIDTNGEKRTISVSGVFVAVGMIPQTDLLRDICKLENGYVRAGECCRTSAKGIFAAGDVRTKSLRQVVTAAADGAAAVNSALEDLS